MKSDDLYAQPEAASKPSENPTVYPCLRLEGEQAKLFGAENLNDGDMVQQNVVWRVKKTTIEKDGEKRYELSLDLVKASEPEPTDEQADDSEGTDDGDSAEPSPGLAYILKGGN